MFGFLRTKPNIFSRGIFLWGMTAKDIEADKRLSGLQSLRRYAVVSDGGQATDTFRPHHAYVQRRK